MSPKNFWRIPLATALLALLAACDATPGQTDRAFTETGQVIAMGGGPGGAGKTA